MPIGSIYRKMKRQVDNRLPLQGDPKSKLPRFYSSDNSPEEARPRQPLGSSNIDVHKETHRMFS